MEGVDEPIDRRITAVILFPANGFDPLLDEGEDCRIEIMDGDGAERARLRRMRLVSRHETEAHTRYTFVQDAD